MKININTIEKLDFEKSGGIIPTIIQDSTTRKVLMQGYMSSESLEKTFREKKVCFWSRSKQRLWTKGESSGNFLFVEKIMADCDRDSLLVLAKPKGNTCHTGNYSCFEEEKDSAFFLDYLQQFISQRKEEMPEGSYTTKLFKKGINKIAQKVGEEAVELIIEAKDNNKELFLNEAADLLYHLIVLLSVKNTSINDILDVLQERHK